MAKKKKISLDELPEEFDGNYPGFEPPNNTPIPDVFFDKIMPFLTEAQLKVMLYIFRRTYGFKKDADDISLSQLVNGIIKKDGKRLDFGTGLHRETVVQALEALIKWRFIIKTKNDSKERGHEPNTYALRMVGMQAAAKELTAQDAKARKKDPCTEIPTSPLYGNSDQPLVRKFRPGLYGNSDQQETGVQDPAFKQETVNTTTQPSLLEGDETAVVVALLTDFGISKGIAKKLASGNDPLYIQGKIDYAQFLLEYAPEKIKNPSGWLRKAIEEDYGAPDGFVSPAEVEEEARQFELEREREEEISRREADRQKKKVQLEQENYDKWREGLNLAYGTTEQDFELWQRALVGLQSQYQSDKLTYNTLVARAEILCVLDDPTSGTGKVILGVETQYAVDRLNHRNKILFEREFKSLFHKPILVEFVAIGCPDPVGEDVEFENEAPREPLGAVNGFAHY